MDPDLVSLLAVADQLLGSLSTSVVLAAAGLLLHLAPAGSELVRHATYTLVQLLNRDYFTSYVVLNVIDELSALDATTFARYVGDFLPRISEPVYIVQSKTRILCRLIAEETVEDVLAALQPFTVHPSADVVVMLVKTLLVVSQKNPASSRLCLRVFTQLLDLRREDVAIARACLMGADRLLHVLDDAAKREALVWMMKLVLEERIAHGGHPVLRWMMDNIYIRTDPAGNIKADKEKSTEKIDGAIATIMGLDRAIRCGNDTGASVYDSRGLLFI